MTTGIAADVSVGDKIDLDLVEDLTRTQIVQYAGASGDYNPLHTDEVFARKVGGVPTVFAHGMLTMGMTGRLLTDRFGADRIVSYSARFVTQVWPGDSLVAQATVDAVEQKNGATLVELSLVTRNQRSEPVLTGKATIRLDDKIEGS